MSPGMTNDEARDIVRTIAVNPNHVIPPYRVWQALAILALERKT